MFWGVNAYPSSGHKLSWTHTYTVITIHQRLTDKRFRPNHLFIRRPQSQQTVLLWFTFHRYLFYCYCYSIRRTSLRPALVFVSYHISQLLTVELVLRVILISFNLLIFFLFRWSETIENFNESSVCGRVKHCQAWLSVCRQRI